MRRWCGSAVLALLLALPGALPAREAPTAPKQAVVASANAAATDAGLEILAAGGNAFDAAVAVSATLGLVEPESSGIGGGGFFLLHVASGEPAAAASGPDATAGRQVFIDARERAPAAASRDMFLDERGQPRPRLSVDGALAAAIPGLPAALDHVAGRYGRLPLSRSLAPAIRLAREGWRFGPKNASMLGWRREVIAGSPAAAALFLVDGKVPEVGTLMRNPDYARTLELIASHGAARGFYRGETARRLVEGVRAAGGIWTDEDLAGYSVVEREPIRFSHRGQLLVTAPPPSSGGVALATMLNVLDGYPYQTLGAVDRSHLLAETMRRAYRDRAIYLGDPDFAEVPVALLASPDYAAGLRAAISMERALPSTLLPGVSVATEGEDTTHFSIIDTAGNMVAVTQTVNLPYGNALVAPGTGFLLNNEMDDFSMKPGVPNAFGLVGEDANAIAPGKRPLSSMTPTLLFGPERAAAIGTPGGSRIISMVLLGLLAVMDDQPADSVVATPRIHHQYLPDRITAEPGALDAATIAALQARGHEIEVLERRWGNMQVALWDRRTGAVSGASDPRGEGVGKSAAGDAIFR